MAYLSSVKLAGWGLLVFPMLHMPTFSASWHRDGQEIYRVAASRILNLRADKLKKKTEDSEGAKAI